MLHIFSSFITFWIKATKETRVDRKEFDDVANIKRFKEYWVYAKINNDFDSGNSLYKNLLPLLLNMWTCAVDKEQVCIPEPAGHGDHG